ncbi:uncharacterized protein [Onthophagus taurus]|uniref:uncharacterized protein n=1 Tax=Onthophagus taurus TaxID=166361 RepID=UPI0039BDF910
MHRRIKSLSFGVPMVWTDPINHDPSVCYACVNSGSGMNRKKMRSKVYLSVPSAQIPLPLTENIPVPKPPSPDVLSGITFSTHLSDTFSLYEPVATVSTGPILVTQNQLDSIVAKLGLSQRKSEQLAKFLNSNNLLAPETKVTAYRHRQSALQKCFTVNEEQTSAYCKDVDGFMREMDILYRPNEWRLFIDSSKISLKAVLLHQTNTKPSVPIAYSIETKETYDTLKRILQNVDYDKHQWRICCDLKVVAILRGLQTGYIKYMCFICDWDSRYKGDQYTNHTWQSRESSKQVNANVIQDPLVPQDKVILPPLHVKLGIVKSFLKTVAKRQEVYAVLAQIFPRLSESKLKEGVVNGPDIRKLVKTEEFDNVLIDND